MMRKFYLLLGLAISVLPSSAIAQVIPDKTLDTQVIPNINIRGVLSDQINGGTIRGSNLFHGFQEFNVNSGRGVYFSNPTGITNIFTRVTGSNPSNINGTLGVQGNANFFFANPNGIVFGSGAKLDIKGSFFGTTASSINFADGAVFSAVNSCGDGTCGAPILTQSIPVGLGFGSQAGLIKVEGTGHQIAARNPTSSPYAPVAGMSGLQVEAGKTLALVGGDINLNGGVISAEAGRVSLGSVKSGIVGLNENPQGFMLDFAGVQQFGDVALRAQALVNVSGNGAGDVQVQGNQVSLLDGSIIWSQNRGIKPSGGINVRAESLEIVGGIADRNIRSSLMAETFAGIGSDITISTSSLSLKDGGGISNRTFGVGESGNVRINAADSILVDGFLAANPNLFSAIGSISFVSGKSGDTYITTPQLSLNNGGIITATTFGNGNAGNLIINSQDIEVIGIGAGLFGSTAITGSSFGKGNAGNITINTDTLSVLQGATINTVGHNSGAAGNININAKKSVYVSGSYPKYELNSNISSSVPILKNLALKIALAIPDLPPADAGNVTINTASLNITQNARVAVGNQGIGRGGRLNLNANSIALDDQSEINATTSFGSEGNIRIQSQNLQLRGSSNVTTNSGGLGNGGSINIHADTIVLLNNSDITANAVEGKGGNINISTQGMFRSADSNITASSELGINGIVNITTPDIKQDSTLQKQATNFINTDNSIANSCIANRNSERGSFIVTGNGGLPDNPSQNYDLPYSVVQVIPVNTSTARYYQNHQEKPTWKIGDAIQEATQLLTTTDGRLILAAAPQSISSTQDLTCKAPNL